MTTFGEKTSTGCHSNQRTTRLGVRPLRATAHATTLAACWPGREPGGISAAATPGSRALLGVTGSAAAREVSTILFGPQASPPLSRGPS
jgi:hypothetical protein